MDDLHPLYRYISLRPDIKRAPALKLAYEITKANLHGNYVRTCKLAEKLCPLTFCAFCLYLPTLQRDALRVIGLAYSSRAGSVPASVLRRWVGFSDEEATKAACDYYGLRVEKDQIHITKGAFKSDAELFKPKIDMRVNLRFEEVL
ncbi:unnamed protein product, partial [Iphiclides podalirius]